MLARGAAAAAATVVSLALQSATARPYTVDDLLAEESFGKIAVDPSGRWLVFEQRGRYDELPAYDTAYDPGEAFARLRRVDLRHPEAARPLIAGEDPQGLALGPFSPSGRRLVVYRLQDRRWSFAIVTLATGEVTWLEAAPLEPGRGRTVQWRSDDELLAILRSDPAPPATFRSGWQAGARLTAAWSAAARGAVAVSAYGSGAYAAVRTRPADRRLVRIDAASGRQTELARGPFFDLELSPDTRTVAVLASGPDVQPRADGPVRGVAGSETEASALQLVDTDSGRSIVGCGGCDLLPQLLNWSPDSARLLVFRRGGDGLWSSGRLLAIDAATGRAEDVQGALQPTLQLNPVVVRAGWMGRDPILLASQTPDTGDAWFRLAPGEAVRLTHGLPTPPTRLLAADARHLVVAAGRVAWRIDGQGHARRFGEGLTPALPLSAASEGARLRSGPAGHTPVVDHRGDLSDVTADGLRPIARLGPDAGEVMAVAQRAGVVLQRTPAGVQRLAVHTADGQAMAVATLDTHLAETDPPRARAVHHRGPNGEPLTSWLFLPADTPPDHPPPLIIRPYLGAAYAEAPRDPPAEAGVFQNLRLLTGHGYAVLVPSLPAPPGGLTEPAAGLADRLLAIERAAREDPALAGSFDPQREALLGWSFGGYTVMAAVTQTAHFRAAVAFDGISDLAAYWSHISLQRAIAPEDGYGSNWSTGTVEATQPQLKVPLWADPDRYRRNSPLWQADRIVTPLMLVHGWRDSVPIAGSEAMYSALFRQGKDALLVTYWGADHKPTSPGDIRDVWQRTFAFLDAHLDVRSGDALPSGHPQPGSASSGPRLPPPPH